MIALCAFTRGASDHFLSETLSLVLPPILAALYVLVPISTRCYIRGLTTVKPSETRDAHSVKSHKLSRSSHRSKCGRRYYIGHLGILSVPVKNTLTFNSFRALGNIRTDSSRE